MYKNHFFTYNEYMENKKPKVGKLPTIKQTHILNFIFFIIIALLWIPYGFAFFIKQADARTYPAILLIPLPIIGLFLSRKIGILIANYIFYKTKRPHFYLAALILFIINIFCAISCLAVEISSTGYPLKACLSVCHQLNTVDVLTANLKTIFLLNLPAFFAAYQYLKNKK